MTNTNLSGFLCQQSTDDLKIDLELTCANCGEHLCDVEDGDSLETLCSVAREHTCNDEKATCLGCGAMLDDGGDGESELCSNCADKREAARV